MIRLLLYVFVFYGFSVSAADACKLPRAAKISIGCTYECDWIYRLRLSMSAITMGYPLSFVNLRQFADAGDAMESVDAVLIPGGADIDPEYYLPSISTELATYTRENLNLVNYSQEGKYRDYFEYDLVNLYSKDERFEKLPMLGICRGMQMMSVAQGIPLYLDIKSELGIKNRYRVFDRINVNDPTSTMKVIYKNRKFRGFKQHHQGIRMDYYLEHQDDYPLTKVTATSNKGLIAEAIEYTHRTAIGVQYHPEKSFLRTSHPVYNWFLTKSCEYKNLKDSL